MPSTTHVPSCLTSPIPDRRLPSLQETHRLVTLFLPDYLRLAEPDSAAQMDLLSCSIVPVTGSDETTVIRAKVTSNNGENVAVIVLVEPAPLSTHQMALKIVGILKRCDLTYGLPVLLSVIYLSGGRPGIHLESTQISALENIEYVRIYFTAWGLSESRADHYLSRYETLAWAIAPYMRSTSHTQQQLLETARARIESTPLPDETRDALLRFLFPERHCELNGEIA